MHETISILIGHLATLYLSRGVLMTKIRMMQMLPCSASKITEAVMLASLEMAGVLLCFKTKMTDSNDNISHQICLVIEVILQLPVF